MVNAAYWATDYVDGITSAVISADDSGIDKGLAKPLFNALASALLGGEDSEAAKFVDANVDDADCTAGCQATFSESTIKVTYGVNGARQLEVGR